MIIDFHTHTFPNSIADRAIKKLSHTAGVRPFSDGTEIGLSASTRLAGIDLAVILPVATSPQQVSTINDSSARINEHISETGLFSIGAIHPDTPDYKQVIRTVRDLGLRGIKIHPVYQGCALDDDRFLNIMSYAAELGLFTVTHTGIDIGFPELDLCSPHMARSVWHHLGNIPLVLAHMGGWGQWQDVPELLSETGFMLDTAFSTGTLHTAEGFKEPVTSIPLLDKDGFLRIYHAFGPSRILFGTDSPWSDPTESIDFIRSLDLSESDFELIMSGNARRLLS
jgi:predicted TIM-barrel fold metal-dependent hydrolase